VSDTDDVKLEQRNRPWAGKVCHGVCWLSLCCVVSFCPWLFSACVVLLCHLLKKTMRKGKVMRPFRAPRLIVKETEEGNLESSPEKSDMFVPEKDLVPEPETQNLEAASPNLLEFEFYLDGLASKSAETIVSPLKPLNGKPTTLPFTKPANMSTDDWWETVLQSEQQRLQVMETGHDTNAVSSDDDIPIVQTLPVATTKSTKKKKVKSLWSYETVMEPTGARSKYWDSPAPSQRATKELAKHKLQEMNNGEESLEGTSNMNYILFRAHPIDAFVTAFTFHRRRKRE
jgi:hypothetical protein